MMRTSLQLVLAVLVLSAPAWVQARCPAYRDVVAYVASYLNREPAKSLPGVTSLADAQCAQGAVASELARHKGSLAGFRAGFANKAMQQRYNVEGPLRAFLFKNMFVADGAVIEAQFGARPLFEANLIAVVKDGELQEAKTPLEALAHISHFVPYIELSDLALGEEEPLTKVSMIATNVGTRMGVLGTPIAVEPTAEFLGKLEAMTVVVSDQEGRELSRARGDALSHQPMSSVLWLARSLSYDGIRILQNDKLSLGGFTPGEAPTAGTRIKVQYLGLPGDPSVSVMFR